MKWMTAKKVAKKSSIDFHRKSVTTRRLREPIEHRIKSSRSVAAEPSEAEKVAEILMSKVCHLGAKPGLLSKAEAKLFIAPKVQDI